MVNFVLIDFAPLPLFGILITNGCICQEFNFCDIAAAEAIKERFQRLLNIFEPKRQSGKLVSLIDFSLGLVTCLGKAMYPSTTKVHNVKVLKAFN